MVLIKNGLIHDGKGGIYPDMDILIENGMFKEISQGIEAKENMKVIDAKGKTIFPGFIDSLNHWGCKGPGWGDDDLSENSDPVTPQLSTVYSFDHESMVFQRVFEYGVTSAGIAPSTSNVLGGQVAVFKTYGTHPYKMLVKEAAAMMASISKATKQLYGGKNLAPMTKMGAVALLKQALMDGINYEPSKESTAYDGKKEAMKKVTDKRMPLFINCETKSELDALELALKDFSVDIVYTGAFGVKHESGKIAEKKQGIILGDLTQAMTTVNSTVDFQEISKLMEEGVEVAISCCGDRTASGKESLLWNAILCYKYGLDSEQVLKMVTSIPAKLLGVDDQIGSIEEGKDADFVIWYQNPIETYSAVAEQVYINGENVLELGRELSCW